MKINFSINYKGYTADISYEPEDKIYVGEVRCISDSFRPVSSLSPGRRSGIF